MIKKSTYPFQFKNVGSTEVQIALLTYRIRHITEHLKVHKKDVHAKYGLLKLASRRKKTIAFLKTTKKDVYLSLITQLKLKK